MNKPTNQSSGGRVQPCEPWPLAPGAASADLASPHELGKGFRLLALCDTPTRDTGFGRVAQNLFSRWIRDGVFEEVHVWGIGYEGWPYDRERYPYTIYPAQRYADQDWSSPGNLSRFLSLLAGGSYTHVWIMQDTFLLSPGINGHFPSELKRICKAQGIRSLLYFPVDAPLEKEWAAIIEAVDVPVAYCEYGVTEAQKVCDQAKMDEERGGQFMGWEIGVIPHGVDHSIYYPNRVSPEERAKVFCGMDGKSMVEPDEFLIVNVNMNQRRKGVLQTLLVFNELLNLANVPGNNLPRMKLYLHMRRENKAEGIDLALAVRQLGLQEHVLFAPDKLWPAGVPESALAQIYNMADLLLTTSLGEGWGLSITEAMACGTPVAGPCHTSIAELMGIERGVLLPTGALDIATSDNTRLRPRVDVVGAAEKISEAIQNDWPAKYAERAQRWVGDLGWDRIAKTWEEYL